MKVLKLRAWGKTYQEINDVLKLKIPRATLSNWCNEVALPIDYQSKVTKLNKKNLEKARQKALKVNRKKRELMVKNMEIENQPAADTIKDYSVGMVALAMLCLGEASKYKSRHKQFSLGSSDRRIIIIFLRLLRRFNNFDPTKLRCTVLCRADQNIVQLENYWRQICKIPKSQFYKARVDKRTVGKPTKSSNYRGVLVIDYFDRHIQLVLETLADLVYNRLLNEGP